MSERIVYLGDFKNTKKQDLFNKALMSLKANKGQEFYYMLPNGSLLKDYREKLVSRVKSSFEINLFTFDDIVNRTLENTKYLSIDNIWKSFIISQLVEKLLGEKNISYYRTISNKSGFIESVNFIIGEIKRSLISPEEFLRTCPDGPEYREIGLIYKEYENYIEERELIDRESSYSKALEILKASENNFKDIEFIIIDEFYDFRPIEIEILKMMKKSHMDIYINIPFKMEYKSSILENTIGILEDLEFDIEIIEEGRDDLFLDIGKNFFSYQAEGLKNTQDITLIEAPNSHLEIKWVFSEIKRMHALGIPFDQMGIVALSDEYREKLIDISIEEELPLSIESKMALIKIPFIRSLLKSLEDNYSQAEMTVEIKKEDSFKNYHQIVLDLIEKSEIKRAIEDINLKLDDFELYKRDLLALDKLLEILTDLDKIEVWEECLSFSAYFNLLLEYLKSEEIYLKHENAKGIRVMNPVNTRGFECQILFVTGLSQNQYPVLKADNFLLRDENKDELEKIGLNYWDYNNRLDNEAVKFADLIAMAEEELYLSYSTGDQNIASMFLEEILDRFESENVEEKVNFIKLELDYIFKNDFKEISTKEELINYLLLQLDEEENKDYFALYNQEEADSLNHINQKIIGEYHRSKEEFNHYRGNISDEDIVEDLKDMHRDKIYSSTYLETYAKCPFSFFMKYIVQAEPVDIEDESYSPMDIGSIYHQLLRSYYSSYREAIASYVRDQSSFDIDESLKDLKNLLTDQARSMELDTSTRSSELVLETMHMYLKDYIKSDIDRLKNNRERSLPIDFELEFGKNGDFIINTEERDIKLTGKIDRIDKILNEDKYVLIDYKSGSSGIYGIDSMKEGISLQLPIYMLSQEERNIVLAMYGEIKNSKFAWKIGLKDQTSIIAKNNKGAISTEERDELMTDVREHISHIVEAISQGDFSVNPKECSSYCPYQGICRYDHLMEVEADGK